MTKIAVNSCHLRRQIGLRRNSIRSYPGMRAHSIKCTEKARPSRPSIPPSLLYNEAVPIASQLVRTTTLAACEEGSEGPACRAGSTGSLGRFLYRYNAPASFFEDPIVLHRPNSNSDVSSQNAPTSPRRVLVSFTSRTLVHWQCRTTMIARKLCIAFRHERTDATSSGKQSMHSRSSPT